MIDPKPGEARRFRRCSSSNRLRGLLLRGNRRQRINKSRLGPSQFGNGGRSQFPEFLLMLRIEGEVDQFFGVVFEVVEFFDFPFDQGADVLVSAVQQ